MRNCTGGKLKADKMVTLKYIITDQGAMVFPESITHLAAAKGYLELKRPIYAAGFLSWQGGVIIKCYGESESLKIPSKPDIDVLIVEDMFATMSHIKYFGGTVQGKTIKQLYE